VVLTMIKDIVSDLLVAHRTKQYSRSINQPRKGLGTRLLEGQDAAIGSIEEGTRMFFRQRPDELDVERLVVRLLTRVVYDMPAGRVMANVAVVHMNPTVLMSLADSIGRTRRRVAHSVGLVAIETQASLVGFVELVVTEAPDLDIHQIEAKALAVPGTQDAWNAYDHGVPMAARLYLLDGARAGESYPLLTSRRYKVRLGCGSGCDLQIPSEHRLVSAEHAEIETHGSGCFTLRDIGSRNGTCCNDELLVPYVPIPLRHGDIVNLSGYRMQIVNPTLGGLGY
jgi:hypothetical protein